MTDLVTTYFKDPKPEPRPRQWNSTLPRGSKAFGAQGKSIKSSPPGLLIEPNKRKRKPMPKRFGLGVTPEMRSEVFVRAAGRCQADGLHDPRCPGVLNPGWGWNAHHIRPRSKGGADEVGNLLAIWTGGPAAAGCHARLHSRPNEAKALGLLVGRAAINA